jgi:diguanylate cyclase (GGDEF)-like protein
MLASPCPRSGTAGSLRHNRLLPASGLIMMAAVIWFAANLDRPTGPFLLLWLPGPLASAVTAVAHWRTSRTAELPAPTRRFWRHQCAAAVLVGVATIVQAHDALRDPYAGGQQTGPVMLAIDSLAILIILWSLLRLPLGTQTRGERLRVGLDAGTVMLATALFLWHFHTRPLLVAGGDRATVLATAAMLTVLALVGVFAVAKVALSSYAFFDKGALRLLAFAMLLGSLSSVPQRFLDRPYLVFAQVATPTVMFFATWASQRQRAAGQARAASPAEVGRRRFSVLPYAAVAAVDALLMGVLLWPDGDALVVGAAAVLLTAVVVLRQITAFQDNRRLLDRLDHGATHDALTQLPNRRLFTQRLHEALTVHGGHPVSVALIDLDDFKVVNDSLGHETGDALLVAVARRLATCVRPADTVARLGGDEFVVIFDGLDAAGAAGSAERITAALAAPVVAAGHELLVRASIGIAAGGAGDDAGDLLRQADIAMYAAKHRGGGRHLCYEAGMAGAVANLAHLGADLRQAIVDDQLYLLYQPIVDLDDDRLIGVEALVRWAHPERGPLPPGEFIPLAERSGLVVPLGRWVLRQACRDFVTWSARDGAPAVLNVNVSARELREPGFAAEVAAVLARTGMPAHRLVLEVTETAVVELGTAVTNLRALRELGVRISLDDFGTGHSTFTLLQNLAVDELKLDRSFTQADATGEPTVAAAVWQLARVFGLDVVAEGVETPQQAARLRQLGYQAAQGYHFARPMPAADIARALGPLAAQPHPTAA